MDKMEQANAVGQEKDVELKHENPMNTTASSKEEDFKHAVVQVIQESPLAEDVIDYQQRENQKSSNGNCPKTAVVEWKRDHYKKKLVEVEMKIERLRKKEFDLKSELKKAVETIASFKGQTSGIRNGIELGETAAKQQSRREMSGDDEVISLKRPADENIEALLNAVKVGKMKSFFDIPLEIQEMIVQRCTDGTRKALRACSLQSKQLVEETRVNSICKLSISCDEGNYKMKIKKKGHEKTKETFENHKVFQKALTEMLKSVHCIEYLKVVGDFKIKLVKWENGYEKRLLVERVYIANRFNIKDVLFQIEPVFLSEVDYLVEGLQGNFDTTVYDLPQIINAERVHLGPGITEEQLSKLTASYIFFMYPVFFGWQIFIRNFRMGVYTKLRVFEFENMVDSSLEQLYPPGDDGRVLLNTLKPDQKIVIKFDHNPPRFAATGYIRYASERCATAAIFPDQSVLRKLRVLTIRFDHIDGCWYIDVLRDVECIHKFLSFEEAQEKLNDILENTDSINCFTIRFYSTNRDQNERVVKKLKWKPRMRALLVRTLEVRGNHSETSIHDLLAQIDLSLMESLEISSTETEETIYDMDHICDIDKVKIVGSVLRDDQLINMNSTSFTNSASENVAANMSHNGSITEAGIIRYVQKWLLNPPSIPQQSFLHKIAPTLNPEEILSGLDVFWSARDGDTLKALVGSDTNDSILILEFSDGNFSMRSLEDDEFEEDEEDEYEEDEEDEYQEDEEDEYEEDEEDEHENEI